MDTKPLIALNGEIASRENVGDVPFFEMRLADSFAMRRADGSIVDRVGFLAALKSGGGRETVAVDEVCVFGRSRALVRCRVRVDGRMFDNVRLFVSHAQSPEGWQLLAWANEPVDG